MTEDKQVKNTRTVKIPFSKLQKTDQSVESGKIALDLDPVDNELYDTVEPVEIKDEQGLIGSEPDPEDINQDDWLDKAHKMGQQMEEDDEHPEEIDIARDIDKAEKYVHE